jgi:hypothetical protein
MSLGKVEKVEAGASAATLAAALAAALAGAARERGRVAESSRARAGGPSSASAAQRARRGLCIWAWEV